MLGVVERLGVAVDDVELVSEIVAEDSIEDLESGEELLQIVVHRRNRLVPYIQHGFEKIPPTKDSTTPFIPESRTSRSQSHHTQDRFPSRE